MLVPIPGQLTPNFPVPVPAGLTYAQSTLAGPNDSFAQAQTPSAAQYGYQQVQCLACARLFGFQLLFCCIATVFC